MTTSPLLSLPPEIILKILPHLPPRSLLAIILTCHALHDLFLSTPLLPAWQLLTLVPEGVLPEAMLVMLARKRSPRIPIREFCAGLLGRRMTDIEVRNLALGKLKKGVAKDGVKDVLKTEDLLGMRIRLRDVGKLWDVWGYIQLLTEDMIVKFLQEGNKEGVVQSTEFDRKSSGTSETELQRIWRACWRWELYHILFHTEPASEYNFPLPVFAHGGARVVGGQSGYTSTLQHKIFFSQFAHWENEQLAIVMGYLVGLLSKEYNYLVDHDIGWGATHIGYSTNASSSLNNYLPSSGGLLAVRKLLDAKEKSWSERIAVFDQGNSEQTKGLYTALQSYTVVDSKGDGGVSARELAAFTAEDEKKFIPVGKGGWSHDSDCGPEKAWRWAYAGVKSAEFVFDWERRRERRWGFVMWDRETLYRWGVIYTKNWWVRPEARHDWAERPQRWKDEDLKRTVALTKSRERRTEIFKKGGRGYWSWEDEGKIIWDGDVMESD